MILRKNRESPDQFYWSGDFFYPMTSSSPGWLNLYSKEEKMATSEQSFCKMTLFLIKDWDSFQIAMRGCLNSSSRHDTKNSTRQEES